MKKISKEVKIGIAFIIALFVLYYGISFLKGFNKFKPSDSYMVVFENVEGLTKAAPVTLNGFQVGLVSSMELDPNNPKQVVVFLNMNKGVEITKGSKVALDVAMLGGAALTLEINPYTEEIASKSDTIIGERKKGMMEAAGTMLPQVEKMLPKIDSILIGIQALVNNPALEKSLTDVNVITNNLAVSSQQMTQITNKLNKELPTILDNFNSVSSNMAEITQTINGLDVQNTFNALDSTMHNIEYLSSKLTEKDNNVGLLLNDRQLYDSLNVTIGNAAALLKDLKEHPEKYISIKIF